jgi:hypothetical protein
MGSAGTLSDGVVLASVDEGSRVAIAGSVRLESVDGGERQKQSAARVSKRAGGWMEEQSGQHTVIRRELGQSLWWCECRVFGGD